MQGNARTRGPAKADHAGIPADRSMVILEYGIALLAAVAAVVLGLFR